MKRIMKARVGLVLAIALLAGCKSNKITGTSQNSDSTQNNANNAAQVGQYLDSLPTWAEFSPLLPDKDAAPTGSPTVSYDTVASVTTIDSAGNTSISTNVPYVCATTPYSLQQTPQQIVMYSPNAAILYPGAFIQGKSYKSGIGSLLPLQFDKRAPIQVSIPAIQTADNFRTVDTVDEAHIQSAVGAIVGTATDDSAQTSSSIAFHWASYYSESQLALSMNASGHYLGFSASVGGSINTDASQHTVMAEFYEKMFTVVVSPPATPAGWFSSDFTAADLHQQVALGNIGPDNVPVYIGDVVYGRMMMFSLTSTASTSDIQAALNASYNGLFGGGSVSLTAEQQKILQTATIKVASVGGNDAATIAMIRTGDFRPYFTSSAPLSTAAPLSYDFYNLANNTLAKVTEATDYNVTTCSPVKPGQFAFLPAQGFGPPVTVPFETQLVDVDGDGRADLVFNHRDAGSNQVAVALGQADGTFAAPGGAVSDPATPAGGWVNYQEVTGDFNGDGKTDLAWTYPNGDSLAVDVALADGSGGWTFLPETVISAPFTTFATVLDGFKAYVGDIDGNGTSDLVFNQVSTGDNWAYAALSNGDGTFTPDTAVEQLGPLSTWQPYHTQVADQNGDGKADLCFNKTITGTNRIWVATSNGDGTFCSSCLVAGGELWDETTGNWLRYQNVVADFNGDQKPDWLFYSAPDTTSQHLPSQLYMVSDMKDFATPVGILLDSVFPIRQYKLLAGDVNGDGKADVLLNATSSTTNTVAVMLGTSTVPSVGADSLQIYPVSANWSTALPAMVGDVSGDGNADIVWVIPGSPTQVFVALSRGNAAGS